MERTNRPTRAVISRQRPSKIKNLSELIPYRGHFSAPDHTPGCKTPATKNEGMAELPPSSQLKRRAIIVVLLVGSV
jgi:hypothetical protein